MDENEAYYINSLWFLTCSNCGNQMAETDDEGTEIPRHYCPNCGKKITKVVDKDGAVLPWYMEEYD